MSFTWIDEPVTCNVNVSPAQDWAKEEYSGGCPVNVMAPGLLTYYHPSLRKPCGR